MFAAWLARVAATVAVVGFVAGASLVSGLYFGRKAIKRGTGDEPLTVAVDVHHDIDVDKPFPVAVAMTHNLDVRTTQLEDGVVLEPPSYESDIGGGVPVRSTTINGGG